MTSAEGRRRASDASLHKVTDLAQAFATAAFNPAHALDMLIGAAARGHKLDQIWEELHRAARDHDKLSELAFAYEQVTADKRIKLLPPDVQAFVFLRATSFFESYFEDPDGAVAYAERTIAVSPGNAEALGALERLLGAAGRTARLAKFLVTASTNEHDRTAKLSMLARAAEIVDALPDETEIAISVFRETLRADPEATSARARLLELYLSAGQHREAALLVEEGLGSEASPSARRPAHERLVELYTGPLVSGDKALTHIEALLAEDPRHAQALETAELLLENRSAAERAAGLLADARERSGDLVQAAAMLGLELKTVRGPRRVAVQRRLAVLRQDVLGDPTGALELLAPALAGDPGDDELRRRFVELSLALERAPEALRLLTRALQTSRDPAVRARVGVNLGSVHLRTGDVKGAQAAFQQVVETGGDDGAVVEALRQLVELHTKAGDTKSMLSSLELVLKVEPEREARQAAARKLTRYLDQEKADPKRQVNAWKELVGSPWTDEALAKLEAFYTELGAHDKLADVLVQRAERTRDSEEARQLAFRAAEARTARARDRGAAIRAWQDLVFRYGPAREVHARLLPLLEQEQRWSELAQTLSDEIPLCDERDRPPLLVRLAQLHVSRLSSPEAAIGLLAEALRLDPVDRGSRALLEKMLALDEHRSKVAEVLEPIYRAEPPSAGLVSVLEVKGASAEVTEERLLALDEAGRVCEQHLGDPERSLRIAGQALKLAVSSHRAALPQWLAKVKRLAENIGGDATTARLLEEALGRYAVDSDEMLELARAAGDALVRAGEPERAVEAYRAGLAYDHAAPDLLRGLDELLRARGGAEERLVLYEQALEQETEPARRREILHTIARLRRREMGDVAGAVALWHQIIEDDPRDAAAHAALVEAFSQLGDHGGAYRELTRMLPYLDGERRNQTLLRMAEACTMVGDPAQALAHYRELMGLSDVSDAVLHRVEELAHEVGDPAMQRAAIDRRFPRTTDATEQVDLLERLGDILATGYADSARAGEAWLEAGRLCEGLAADLPRAERLYQRLLEIEPEHRVAAQRLFELYAAARQWVRLALPYRVLSAHASPAELIALLLGLEEAAVTLGGGEELVALVRATLTLGIPERERRELEVLLARALESLGRDQEAADAYRRLLSAAGTSGWADAQLFTAFLARREPSHARTEDQRWLYQWRVDHGPEPISVLLEWAAQEETTLHNRQLAIALLQRVLELDPERTDALAELARLRTAEGDAEGALDALERLRDRSEGDLRLATERHIARLLIEELGRVDDALGVVSALLEAAPNDGEALAVVQSALKLPDARARALELLDKAASSTDDPAVRAATLETLVGLSAGAPELVELRGRWLKQLLEAKEDDPSGSYEIAVRAAAEAKRDEELWDLAERFARNLDTPGPLAAAYASVIEQDLEADLAESLGRRMVEFQEEWFEDQNQVIRLLNRVLTLCPSANWAYDRLKLAYNSAGRWAELFELYDWALAHASNQSERVEILREAAMAAKDFAGDADRAISYLERLNQLAPRDSRVEAALERLYERQGHTRPLIELLSGQLDACEDEAQRQVLRARITNLWLALDEAAPAFSLVEAMLASDGAAPTAFELLERLVQLASSQTAMVQSHEGGKKRKKTQASVRERSAALLRRHYEASGNLADAVRMLEVAVDTAHTDEERIERLREVVAVRLEQLDDPTGAFGNVAALVALEPTAEEYRTRLAELAERTGQHERHGEIIVDVAARVEKDALRATLLIEAARVYDRSLQRPERAIELYLEVLSLATEQREAALEAARTLDGMLAASGRSEDRCRVLEQLATLEKEPELRRQALGNAARLAFGELADPDRAAKSWRLRLGDDAEDREALDGLCEALERAERWDELIEALNMRACLVEPALARADVVRIATIHAEKRADGAAAVDAWREVRASFGKDWESFEALRTLLAAQERWQELAQLLSEEAVEAEPERRAELERTLGEVHRDRTGDMAAALRAFVAARDWQRAVEVAGACRSDKALASSLYETLLELAIEAWQNEQSGADAGAAQAADWSINELSQRLLEDGEHKAVIELLLRGAELPFDRQRRRELRRDAACLCSDRLGDGEKAIEIFRGLFAEDPADDVASASVTRLAVLLEERGLDEEIVALWEQQAKCRAEAGDQVGAASLFTRAGQLSEDKLRDEERAIRAYREGAGLGGESSLDALARIYTARGEHKQAAEVLEWLCNQSPRELLSERALRLADAYVAAGERRRARTRLEQAAATAIDAGALRARLVQLYREAKEWGPLALLLADEATRAGDKKARLALLTEAASLHVRQRNDPNAAVPLLTQAVELDQDDAKLRLALADALRLAERYDEGVTILQAQIGRYGSRKPKDRALCHFQLARVLLAAGRRAEALTELDMATRIDPAHPGILQAMARLALEEGQLERAERMYRGLLLVVGRDEDPDAPSRADSLLDLSEIAARQGDDVRAGEFVESAFEAALESDVEAAALERSLQAKAKYALLARALETRLGRPLPPAQAARALSDLCMLHAQHLGGIDEVRGRLHERAQQLLDALGTGNADADAFGALGQVYDILGDSEAAARVLEKRVASAADSSEDPDAFYRLARIRLMDPATREQGLSLLERALDASPELDRAAQALNETGGAADERTVKLMERIARGRDDKRALVGALALVIEVVGPAQTTVEEAVGLAAELADPALKERILRAALDRASDGADAVYSAWLRNQLADVCSELGRHEEALELREQAAYCLPADEQRAPLLGLAQAAVASEDFVRAARLLERLLESEPQDREIWEPLLEIYRRLERNDRLVEVIDQTVALVASAEDRARLRFEQANLVLRDPNRQDEAVGILRGILEEDAANQQATLLLSKILEETGRLDEMAELLRSQLESAKDRQRVPSIIDISMRLGGLLERQQAHHDALDVYRAVLDWDRKSEAALRSVLRMAEVSGDSYLIAESIENILQTERADDAAGLARRLVHLRHDQGDAEGVERALQLAFAANPRDAEVRDALLVRLRDRHDHGAVAQVLTTAVEASPEEQELLEQLVEAYRGAGDQEGALRILNGLVEKQPDTPSLLRRRAQLLAEAGNAVEALADMRRVNALTGEYVAELVAALETAAARVEPPEDVALLLELVDVLEAAGDHGAAAARLAELAREAPGDRLVLRRLAEIESRAENWEAASATYGMLVALEEGAAMVEVALKLADACERSGRFEDARGALERALGVAPDHAELRYALRRLYEALAAYKELAHLVLEEAAGIPDVPTKLQLLHYAGELLMQPEGDLAESIQVLEEAHALSPESLEGVALLARAYAAAGNTEHSLNMLRGVVESYRGRRSKALIDVYREICRIHLAEGFLSDALDALTKAFEMDMKNWQVALELGQLAVEAEEDNTAARAFRAVSMLRPDEGVPPESRAEAHYQLAVLARKQGDARKAKLLLTKALSEYADHAAARELLGQLD